MNELNSQLVKAISSSSSKSASATTQTDDRLKEAFDRRDKGDTDPEVQRQIVRMFTQRKLQNWCRGRR